MPKQPKAASAVNDYQGELFALTSNDAVIPVQRFPEDPAAKLLGERNGTVVYGPAGSYVDVAYRAEHLTNSLKAFGLRNQRLGFDTASNTRQHNAPIWARYRSRVPRVQAGAARNAEEYLLEAKREFWLASGGAAMRASGLFPQNEVDAGSRKMWRGFSESYQNRKLERDRYQRQLAKTIRGTKKILKRAAA